MASFFRHNKGGQTMTLIYAYKGLGITRDIVIYDVNENIITPGAADKVRAIISREGETAKLTVTSDSATSNGSSITKGATNRLRLDDADLDFDPGIYTLRVEFYDNSDLGGEWKMVEKQSFCLEGI